MKSRLRSLLFVFGSAVLLVGAAILYILALRENLSTSNILVRMSLLVQLGFLFLVLLR
jgi:hypothetical protein